MQKVQIFKNATQPQPANAKLPNLGNIDDQRIQERHNLIQVESKQTASSNEQNFWRPEGSHKKPHLLEMSFEEENQSQLVEPSAAHLHQTSLLQPLNSCKSNTETNFSFDTHKVHDLSLAARQENEDLRARQNLLHQEMLSQVELKDEEVWTEVEEQIFCKLESLAEFISNTICKNPEITSALLALNLCQDFDFYCWKQTCAKFAKNESFKKFKEDSEIQHLIQGYIIHPGTQLLYEATTLLRDNSTFLTNKSINILFWEATKQFHTKQESPKNFLGNISLRQLYETEVDLVDNSQVMLQDLGRFEFSRIDEANVLFNDYWDNLYLVEEQDSQEEEEELESNPLWITWQKILEELQGQDISRQQLRNLIPLINIQQYTTQSEKTFGKGMHQLLDAIQFIIPKGQQGNSSQIKSEGELQTQIAIQNKQSLNKFMEEKLIPNLKENKLWYQQFLVDILMAMPNYFKEINEQTEKGETKELVCFQASTILELMDNEVIYLQESIERGKQKIEEIKNSNCEDKISQIKMERSYLKKLSKQYNKISDVIDSFLKNNNISEHLEEELEDLYEQALQNNDISSKQKITLESHNFTKLFARATRDHELEELMYSFENGHLPQVLVEAGLIQLTQEARISKQSKQLDQIQKIVFGKVLDLNQISSGQTLMDHLNGKQETGLQSQSFWSADRLVQLQKIKKLENQEIIKLKNLNNKIVMDAYDDVKKVQHIQKELTRQKFLCKLVRQFYTKLFQSFQTREEILRTDPETQWVEDQDFKQKMQIVESLLIEQLGSQKQINMNKIESQIFQNQQDNNPISLEQLFNTDEIEKGYLSGSEYKSEINKTVIEPLPNRIEHLKQIESKEMILIKQFDSIQQNKNLTREERHTISLEVCLQYFQNYPEEMRENSQANEMIVLCLTRIQWTYLNIQQFEKLVDRFISTNTNQSIGKKLQQIKEQKITVSKQQFTQEELEQIFYYLFDKTKTQGQGYLLQFLTGTLEIVKKYQDQVQLQINNQIKGQIANKKLNPINQEQLQQIEIPNQRKERVQETYQQSPQPKQTSIYKENKDQGNKIQKKQIEVIEQKQIQNSQKIKEEVQSHLLSQNKDSIVSTSKQIQNQEYQIGKTEEDQSKQIDKLIHGNLHNQLQCMQSYSLKHCKKISEQEINKQEINNKQVSNSCVGLTNNFDLNTQGAFAVGQNKLTNHIPSEISTEHQQLNQQIDNNSIILNAEVDQIQNKIKVFSSPLRKISFNDWYNNQSTITNETHTSIQNKTQELSQNEQDDKLKINNTLKGKNNEFQTKNKEFKIKLIPTQIIEHELQNTVQDNPISIQLQDSQIREGKQNYRFPHGEIINKKNGQYGQEQNIKQKLERLNLDSQSLKINLQKQKQLLINNKESYLYQSHLYQTNQKFDNNKQQLDSEILINKKIQNTEIMVGNKQVDGIKFLLNNQQNQIPHELISPSEREIMLDENKYERLANQNNSKTPIQQKEKQNEQMALKGSIKQIPIYNNKDYQSNSISDKQIYKQETLRNKVNAETGQEIEEPMHKSTNFQIRLLTIRRIYNSVSPTYKKLEVDNMHSVFNGQRSQSQRAFNHNLKQMDISKAIRSQAQQSTFENNKQSQLLNQKGKSLSKEEKIVLMKCKQIIDLNSREKQKVQNDQKLDRNQIIQSFNQCVYSAIDKRNVVDHIFQTQSNIVQNQINLEKLNKPFAKQSNKRQTQNENKFKSLHSMKIYQQGEIKSLLQLEMEYYLGPNVLTTKQLRPILQNKQIDLNDPGNTCNKTTRLSKQKVKHIQTLTKEIQIETNLHISVQDQNNKKIKSLSLLDAKQAIKQKYAKDELPEQIQIESNKAKQICFQVPQIQSHILEQKIDDSEVNLQKIFREPKTDKIYSDLCNRESVQTLKQQQQQLKLETNYKKNQTHMPNKQLQHQQEEAETLSSEYSKIIINQFQQDDKGQDIQTFDNSLNQDNIIQSQLGRCLPYVVYQRQHQKYGQPQEQIKVYDNPSMPYIISHSTKISNQQNQLLQIEQLFNQQKLNNSEKFLIIKNYQLINGQINQSTLQQLNQNGKLQQIIQQQKQRQMEVLNNNPKSKSQIQDGKNQEEHHSLNQESIYQDQQHTDSNNNKSLQSYHQQNRQHSQKENQCSSRSGGDICFIERQIIPLAKSLELKEQTIQTYQQEIQQVQELKEQLQRKIKYSDKRLIINLNQEQKNFIFKVKKQQINNRGIQRYNFLLLLKRNKTYRLTHAQRPYKFILECYMRIIKLITPKNSKWNKDLENLKQIVRMNKTSPFCPKFRSLDGGEAYSFFINQNYSQTGDQSQLRFQAKILQNLELEKACASHEGNMILSQNDRAIIRISIGQKGKDQQDTQSSLNLPQIKSTKRKARTRTQPQQQWTMELALKYDGHKIIKVITKHHHKNLYCQSKKQIGFKIFQTILEKLNSQTIRSLKHAKTNKKVHSVKRLLSTKMELLLLCTKNKSQHFQNGKVGQLYLLKEGSPTFSKWILVGNGKRTCIDQTLQGPNPIPAKYEQFVNSIESILLNNKKQIDLSQTNNRQSFRLEEPRNNSHRIVEKLMLKQRNESELKQVDNDSETLFAAIFQEIVQRKEEVDIKQKSNLFGREAHKKDADDKAAEIKEDQEFNKILGKEQSSHNNQLITTRQIKTHSQDELMPQEKQNHKNNHSLPFMSLNQIHINQKDFLQNNNSEIKIKVQSSAQTSQQRLKQQPRNKTHPQSLSQAMTFYRKETTKRLRNLQIFKKQKIKISSSKLEITKDIVSWNLQRIKKVFLHETKNKSKISEQPWQQQQDQLATFISQENLLDRWKENINGYKPSDKQRKIPSIQRIRQSQAWKSGRQRGKQKLFHQTVKRKKGNQQQELLEGVRYQQKSRLISSGRKGKQKQSCEYWYPLQKVLEQKEAHRKQYLYLDNNEQSQNTKSRACYIRSSFEITFISIKIIINQSMSQPFKANILGLNQNQISQNKFQIECIKSQINLNLYQTKFMTMYVTLILDALNIHKNYSGHSAIQIINKYQILHNIIINKQKWFEICTL